jgi:hypothetical protein
MHASLRRLIEQIEGTLQNAAGPPAHIGPDDPPGRHHRPGDQAEEDEAVSGLLRQAAAIVNDPNLQPREKESRLIALFNRVEERGPPRAMEAVRRARSGVTG